MTTTKEYREFIESALTKASEMKFMSEQALLKSGCLEFLDETDDTPFAWMSLLSEECPALSYQKYIQDASADPCFRLAGLLELLRENSILKELQMQGLTIRIQDGKIDFCVSGSMSLDELYKLCEQLQGKPDLPNKK